MKKFYILIFSAVFLGASFSSYAQVYNSITGGNPNGYTLDDPRFWVGGVVPPNPCTGCTIKISSDVTMVAGGGGTTSTQNVFTAQVPAGGPFNDATPITVGMKFQASIASNVTGVRFYKQVGMAGVHTGVLYDNVTSTALGTVAFAAETATGWQDQKFAAPIPIVANHTYIIAVYMADGTYAADLAFFTAAPVVNGVLTGLEDGTDGSNGLFTYGAGPLLPTSTNNSPNYWVDVDFSVDGPFLDDIVLNGSTINLYGNTTFTVNTYLELFNSNVTLGNNPTDVEAIKVNGQIDLNGTSTMQLANNFTSIDVNDLGVVAVPGPHEQIGNPGFVVPGIYSINPAATGGYTAVLQPDGLGSNDLQYLPPPLGLNWYALNCDPAVGGSPNTCTDGFVFGPAITAPAAAPFVASGIVFIGSATLPVQLVQFLANKKDDGTVLLSWATSQEQNSAYFDIERSSDQTGWIKIGTVKAKGYSSTTSNYSFTDKFPLDGGGYYHLKMVDLDGKYKYSKTVSVSNGKDNQPLVIYSNPFSDQIRLKVNVSRAQQLTLTVSDMLGKTYISQSYNAQSGDNYVNLHPNVGGSGMYILRIHGDSYEQTAKLEKQ